jgi:hypothetical protein
MFVVVAYNTNFIKPLHKVTEGIQHLLYLNYFKATIKQYLKYKLN